MKRRRLVLGAVMATVVAGAGAAGVGISSAAENSGSSGDLVNVFVSNHQVSRIQANIRVPEGQSLIFALNAAGNQIYRCDNGTWVFDHPEADSLPDTLIGNADEFRHDRGPIWQEKSTGATIRGASVANAGATDNDIPQLLLRVAEFTNPNGSTTDYGRVQYIQRLNTVGGTSRHITTACNGDNNGVQLPVEYTALYAFYG